MIMPPKKLRRLQEGGDVAAPMPYVAGVTRADRQMDPIVQQLLFGLGGQGGFIPGAMRAAERTFFDEQGRPIVIPQQVAGFSPDQLAAMQLAREQVGRQTPFLRESEQQFRRGLGSIEQGLGQQLGSQRQALQQLLGGAAEERFQRRRGLDQGLRGLDEQSRLARRAERGLRKDIAEQRGLAEESLGQFQAGLGQGLDTLGRAAGRFGREGERLGREQARLGREFGRGIGAATDQFRRGVGAFGRRLGESERLLRGTMGGFDPSMTQQFFDPYEDAVVQQTIEDAMKGAAQADIAQRARDIQTGGESAFGSRARLTAAERAEALGRGLAREVGGLRSAGFQRAQQAAMGEFARQRDAERAAASGLAGLTGQRFDASRGLAGQLGTEAQQRLAAGQSLGGFQQGLAGQQLAAQQQLAQQQLGTAGSQLGAQQQFGGLLGQQAQNIYGAGNLLGQTMGQLGQSAMQARMASGQAGLGTAGQVAQGFGQLGNIQGQTGQQLGGAQQAFGQQLQGLGGQFAAAGQQDVGSLMGIGGLQQGLRQEGLDAQRAALLQAQQAPLQQFQSLLPFMDFAARQTGPSGVTTEYTPPPSPLQAGLGTGLSALGALGQFFNPQQQYVAPSQAGGP